jgi:fumarate hydratase class I
MTDIGFTELLPTGPDTTPYRKLTSDHVSTFEAKGKTFLEVDPAGLTLLTREAMRDIAHLLRPGHLKQLAGILDDPRPRSNDKLRGARPLEERQHRGGRCAARCAKTPARPS